MSNTRPVQAHAAAKAHAEEPVFVLVHRHPEHERQGVAACDDDRGAHAKASRRHREPRHAEQADDEPLGDRTHEHEQHGGNAQRRGSTERRGVEHPHGGPQGHGERAREQRLGEDAHLVEQLHGVHGKEQRAGERHERREGATANQVEQGSRREPHRLLDGHDDCASERCLAPRQDRAEEIGIDQRAIRIVAAPRTLQDLSHRHVEHLRVWPQNRRRAHEHRDPHGYANGEQRSNRDTGPLEGRDHPADARPHPRIAPAVPSGGESQRTARRIRPGQRRRPQPARGRQHGIAHSSWQSGSAGAVQSARAPPPHATTTPTGRSAPPIGNTARESGGVLRPVLACHSRDVGRARRRCRRPTAHPLQGSTRRRN